MIMNADNLRNIKECNKDVVIANGTVIRAKYVGDLVCKQGYNLPELLPCNRLPTLNLSYNLISVTSIANSGITVTFSVDKAIFQAGNRTISYAENMGENTC
jgi:hypothetical protein